MQKRGHSLRKGETRAAGWENADQAVRDESSGVPRTDKNHTRGLEADPLKVSRHG
jgi:hypothetical protein